MLLDLRTLQWLSPASPINTVQEVHHTVMFSIEGRRKYEFTWGRFAD